MEDAERVRAVFSAIPTVLDCTGDLVNDSASSRDICFTFFDTWRVLHDEECLSSLEVVNGRLKLLAISLGEVWGYSVRVTPSFSAICLDFRQFFDRPPQLGAVGPVVYALNKFSPLFIL